MLLNVLVITVYTCYHPPAESDYSILVSSITIPANNLTACFSVGIVDDIMDEPDSQTFLVQVIYSGAENVTLGSRSIVEVIILG